MQKKILPHLACYWVLKTLEWYHKWLPYKSYFPKIIPYASLMTVICYKIISTMICTEPLMHFVTKSSHCLALKSWKDWRENKQEKKGTMCPQAKTQWRGWNWRAKFPLSWQGWQQLWRRSQCRGQGPLCPDGHSSHCSSGTYMGVAVSCPGRGRDTERFNSCFPDEPGGKWHVPNPVWHTWGRAQPCL